MDVNGVFEYGHTYLNRAISKNVKDLIHLLLKAGADPNGPTLFSHKVPFAPPLYFALQSNTGLPLLALLKDHGADVHWKDEKGNNLFAVFLSAKHIGNRDLDEKIKWLLNQGVSSYERNTEGLHLLQHPNLFP